MPVEMTEEFSLRLHSYIENADWSKWGEYTYPCDTGTGILFYFKSLHPNLLERIEFYATGFREKAVLTTPTELVWKDQPWWIVIAIAKKLYWSKVKQLVQRDQDEQEAQKRREMEVINIALARKI